MRKKFSDSFYEMYNTGFREYEKGDWGQAKKFLEMAEVLFYFIFSLYWERRMDLLVIFWKL
jgi:outer membrane protein assembly factor BamD (BamD/ComL family)